MVASIGSSLRISPSLLLGFLLCAIHLVVAEETSFYKSVSRIAPIAQGCRTFFFFFSSLLLFPGLNSKLIDHLAQRPDIYPPVFDIQHTDPKKLAPGYIFITPYESQNPGPYIFDNSGVCIAWTTCDTTCARIGRLTRIVNRSSYGVVGVRRGRAMPTACMSASIRGPTICVSSRATSRKGIVADMV